MVPGTDKGNLFVPGAIFLCIVMVKNTDQCYNKSNGEKF